jgi:NAD(P)-dependent dehydrogenase (short-subunit alcohol dehydrogenase family)
MGSDLSGGRALVIGAGNPAGRGIALALAGAGMDVALASATVEGDEVMAVRRTKRTLADFGRRVPEYAFDTTLGQNVQVSTRQVAKELGGLELLVNAQGANAPGAAAAATSGRMSDSDWGRALALHLNGVFFACRAALREMEGRGGAIINVVPLPLEVAGSMAAIEAAAAGVIGLTRGLAREFRDRGVRVNAIQLRPGAQDALLASAGLLLASPACELTGQVLHLE